MRWEQVWDFYFFLFLYPYVMGYFQPLFGDEMYIRIFFTSIPMIQWEGIVQLLADQPQWVGWMTGILVAYPLVLVFWLTIRFHGKINGIKEVAKSDCNHA